jgi:hypothetical protein
MGGLGKGRELGMTRTRIGHETGHRHGQTGHGLSTSTKLSMGLGTDISELDTDGLGTNELCSNVTSTH